MVSNGTVHLIFTLMWKKNIKIGFWRMTGRIISVTVAFIILVIIIAILSALGVDASILKELTPTDLTAI